MADVQRLIDQIMSAERIRRSSHFSDRVFTDEPILTTGRQMASYLPDRYREMRAISRWQADSGGGRGRWLSEAELFYRQGRFMEDFEDDCPYHGTFKAYFPTYNAMSDRQLRGYFTWRAAVRTGTVEETSLSFAYVYLYELLCGIGTHGPLDGFSKLRGFWEAYRGFAPEIDRFARGEHLIVLLRVLGRRNDGDLNRGVGDIFLQFLVERLPNHIGILLLAGTAQPHLERDGFKFRRTVRLRS